MPVIERGWPGGVRALARFARLTADDERWLSQSADAAARSVIRIGAGGVELIRASFVQLPAPVARRVVRQALELAGGTPVLREIELVGRLARTGRGGRGADLHGLRVDCTQEVLRLLVPRAEAPIRTFEYRLDGPGEVRITETDALLQASLFSGTQRQDLPEGWEGLAALQASSVRWPLTIRSRRPGDRFRPLGAPGQRSLQDLFVDRKVPGNERHQMPIVVDAAGRIVWVAPLAMADRCRVRAAEDGMVILKFKKGTL
jgi:tRNA(Ile)-lysidine synthetase-like protein